MNNTKLDKVVICDVYSPYMKYNSREIDSEPRNSCSQSMFNRELTTHIEENSIETDVLNPIHSQNITNPIHSQNITNQQNTPKSNKRRSIKKSIDEDQYVALGTKIIMLIIKIVSSCKPKKRAR
jgi:lipid II:glycine glycyltransferase (peptidoglycan interpeptide bridge formation enzyme)